MKAVIIGGGIAGLSSAILLRKKNWEVVVCEKQTFLKRIGLAFLIKTEALETLEKLDSHRKFSIKTNKISHFTLKNCQGNDVLSDSMSEWHAVRRYEIIQFLYRLLPSDSLKENKGFSHFLYENEQAIAAVFEDGTVEYGDLFIGADGGQSLVRNSVSSRIVFNPNEVNELVCIIENQDQVVSSDYFVKHQSVDKGLSVGLVPLPEKELVCFFQYDNQLVEREEDETLPAFAARLAQNFPAEIQDLVRKNDFTTAQLWKPRDLHLLPTYSKANVVLIGDAAHVSLPFTSAGVSGAVIDAKILVDCLTKNPLLPNALQRYETLRKPQILQLIDLATHLKKQFLAGIGNLADGYVVPLMGK